MKRLPEKEDFKYRRIYGGLAWPGKRPGFAVIVGEEREFVPGLNAYPLRVLDEFETDDLVSLARHCTGLDFYYRPERWLGDTGNMAGMEFIYQLNKEFKTREAMIQGRRNFNLMLSHFVNMDNGFEYLFSSLRKYLTQDRKLLYIGEKSRLASYLLEVRPDEIASIRTGDYPAIESLGYAAVELERSQFEGRKPRQDVADSEYDVLG